MAPNLQGTQGHRHSRTGTAMDGGSSLLSISPVPRPPLLENMFGLTRAWAYCPMKRTAGFSFLKPVLSGRKWGMETTGRAAVGFPVTEDPMFHSPFYRATSLLHPHPSEVLPGPSRGAGQQVPGAFAGHHPAACWMKQSVSWRLPSDAPFPQCLAGHPSPNPCPLRR